ncbi:uncharacterized protein LOC142616325 [Castanea sativa]|uniref:uncharacterized protein LOC142616325 n=1 Tax=Castanea sativa TaxID=21020 RepID=UPI003F64F107
MIVNGPKKRLEGSKGNWAEELPDVLWAYQTTLRRSTSETSFSLTYEAKAVIPIEISLLGIRVEDFTQSDNGTRMVGTLDSLEEKLVGTLDSLEEKRDMISVRHTDYQQKLARGYNRNVKPREFVAGVLVLQKVVGSMKDLSAG